MVQKQIFYLLYKTALISFLNLSIYIYYSSWAMTHNILPAYSQGCPSQSLPLFFRVNHLLLGKQYNGGFWCCFWCWMVWLVVAKWLIDKFCIKLVGRGGGQIHPEGEGNICPLPSKISGNIYNMHFILTYFLKCKEKNIFTI